MTLKTWKEDFYPISAEKAAELSWKEAVQHSLRKWEGFLPENLEAHQVFIRKPESRNGEYLLKLMEPGSKSYLPISSTTCSLCQKAVDDCRRCPIVSMRERSCDNDEFSHMVKLLFPTPMIELLKKTLEFVSGEEDAEGAVV